MKNKIQALIALFFLLSSMLAQGQESARANNDQETTLLFQDSSPLSVVLKYSNKEMKKETDDSTYIKSSLSYELDGVWDSLEVQLRARGNWRKANCFLTPVKMVIKKKERKKTVFKGNKELKLVLPCQNSDRGHDYVLKEYIAYKLYEIVTPYHFKTRRLHIDYSDVRKRKEKAYELLGFVIEDVSEVAKRNDAKRVKRAVHPLAQDDYTSVQSDLFQFLIGNTDFSSTYQHNAKLISKGDVKAIPVPYDFDMSGFVDASYAVVSQVQGQELEITDVRQRLYRGFQRNADIYEAVRQDYISKKDKFFEVLESFKSDFLLERQYDATASYLRDFFDILEDDRKYKEAILDKARN